MFFIQGQSSCDLLSIADDCYESKKTTTAKDTCQLNISLANPFITKTMRRKLHRLDIHERASIAKPPSKDETKPPSKDKRKRRE